jgi:hypothetical protein
MKTQKEQELEKGCGKKRVYYQENIEGEEEGVIIYCSERQLQEQKE